jgi:type I restriction enzyme R subunit
MGRDRPAERLRFGQVRAHADLDPDGALRGTLADGLHGEVAAMNRDNFIVRMHLETVERFQDRAAWEKLSEADRETLQREVADLPSEIATDDIESRLFDLTTLRMQLALAEADQGPSRATASG